MKFALFVLLIGIAFAQEAYNVASEFSNNSNVVGSPFIEYTTSGINSCTTDPGFAIFGYDSQSFDLVRYQV